MEPQVMDKREQSSNGATFRYAIIEGGGGIAATHLQALAQIPNAQVAGISDLNVGGAAKRAGELGCAHFSDHREMLAQLKPDIAVICTPHPTHAALAIDSL